MNLTFEFDAELWIWTGQASWHFITLPQEVAGEIRFFTGEQMGGMRRGFGSLRVQVISAEAEWKTSIFPDKKTGSYLLPIKAQIRKQLDWQAGTSRQIALRIIES